MYAVIPADAFLQDAIESLYQKYELGYVEWIECAMFYVKLERKYDIYFTEEFHTKSIEHLANLFRVHHRSLLIKNILYDDPN